MIFLFIFLFFISTFAEAAPACARCHNSITGEYIKSQLGDFHRQCFESSPKCGYCKGPVIISGVREGQDTFHGDCATRLPKCGECHRIIPPGPYQTFRDKPFHPSCLKKLPVCPICTGPLTGGIVTIAGENIHFECRPHALYCEECKLRITGQYVKDLYGRKLCHRHGFQKKCFTCLNTGEALIDLKDGRLICQRCFGASPTAEQARAKFAEVRQRMQEQFHLLIQEPLNFEIVDQTTIRHKKGDAPEGLRGLFVREWISENQFFGMIPVPRKKSTIYVLSYMPRQELEGVLAHELTHAWQAENCPADQALNVREGIAEMVAWKYAVIYNNQLAKIIQERNLYPDYRDGLKRCNDLAARHTFKKVLSASRNAKDFADFKFK